MVVNLSKSIIYLNFKRTKLKKIVHLKVKVFLNCLKLLELKIFNFKKLKLA